MIIHGEYTIRIACAWSTHRAASPMASRLGFAPGKAAVPRAIGAQTGSRFINNDSTRIFVQANHGSARPSISLYATAARLNLAIPKLVIAGDLDPTNHRIHCGQRPVFLPRKFSAKPSFMKQAILQYGGIRSILHHFPCVF